MGRNIHREDGPAVEYPNGDKEWYEDGCLHRLDGPAVEFANGNGEWWINGQWYSFNEFLKKLPEEEDILMALEWL
jgi:hypothetical protein